MFKWRKEGQKILAITTGLQAVFEAQNLWNTKKGVSVIQQLNLVYFYYVQANFRIIIYRKATFYLRLDRP